MKRRAFFKSGLAAAMIPVLGNQAAGQQGKKGFNLKYAPTEFFPVPVRSLISSFILISGSGFCLEGMPKAEARLVLGSASIARTSYPSSANNCDQTAQTVVLPTPPLPPIAIFTPNADRTLNCS